MKHYSHDSIKKEFSMILYETLNSCLKNPPIFIFQTDFILKRKLGKNSLAICFLDRVGMNQVASCLSISILSCPASAHFVTQTAKHLFTRRPLKFQQKKQNNISISSPLFRLPSCCFTIKSQSTTFLWQVQIVPCKLFRFYDYQTMQEYGPVSFGPYNLLPFINFNKVYASATRQMIAPVSGKTPSFTESYPSLEQVL